MDKLVTFMAEKERNVCSTLMFCTDLMLYLLMLSLVMSEVSCNCYILLVLTTCDICKFMSYFFIDLLHAVCTVSSLPFFSLRSPTVSLEILCMAFT